MSVENAVMSGTKQSRDQDTTRAEIPLKEGIYKGIVKRIDTSTRNGRLWVYIPQFGGDAPNQESNWTLVNYASPFSGQTQGQPSTTQSQLNNYSVTKQSYGFFMVSPDIESIVLCCFPAGETKEGYWFACISSDLSRYMTPGLGAVTLDKISSTSIPADLAQYLSPGRKYPVGEFNEYDPTNYQSGWAAALKPLNVPQTVKLITQGLDQDLNSRGAITSSMQRDPVSSVYGFSTPGRPEPRQDIANIPNLRQQIVAGTISNADLPIYTRVGGHSLVMDDGDIFKKNNLVRIRSSAGHQILMDDSDGYMYISNSTGSAWVELTKEGDVLIYGKRDLSIRTEGNLMMHSDHNISLSAMNSVNIFGGSKVALEGQTVQVRADASLNLYGQRTQLKSGSSLSIRSVGGMGITAGGSMSLKGSKIALNGGGGGGDAPPPTKLSRFSLPDSKPNGFGWVLLEKGLTSINYKVPTHEPYVRGSVAAVIRQQEAAITDTEQVPSQTDIDGNAIDPPVVTPGVNVTLADIGTVARPAPTSSFIQQPDPGAVMGVLNNDQLRAYTAQIGYTEGNGSYAGYDNNGSQGKYKLDSQTLQDLGYVRVGTPQTQEALNNPANWTGRNGIGSPQDFYASPATQEQTMYDYTARNYKQLQVNGIITQDTPADKVAGLLSAAHIAGVPNTIQWYRSTKDAVNLDKTAISEYYNQGRFSQTQVATITASNTSKIVARV
jgi:hypothetical protein